MAGLLTGLRITTAFFLIGTVAAFPAQGVETQPSFRTLALCLLAFEKERALASDANARLVNAKFNSTEEAAAIADQNKYNQRASSIRQVCDRMERDDKPVAEQVKALTGLVDALGPTGGSMRAPVTGAIRQRNLNQTGDQMQQIGGTLDDALADLHATRFDGRTMPQTAPLTGRPDPALGADAAASLRTELAEWEKQENERQRLAALAEERLRMERAEQARIELAEARALRQAEAHERTSRQSSRNAGLLGTLVTIGAVGLGVAAGVQRGSSGQTPQTTRNSSQDEYGGPDSDGCRTSKYGRGRTC